MKKISKRIYINNSDICDGVKGNPFKCAIARAITRQFPVKVKQVKIADRIEVITIYGGYYLASVSERMSDYITDFDSYFPVEKTSFNIEFVRP